VRRGLIGSAGGAGAPTPWAAARLSGPFCLPFVSRVFSYLLDDRKVVHNPFVSM
jgi:hypothetical protein